LPFASSSTKHTNEGNSASKEEASAPPHPRASLLGLPTELRLMIYHFAKESEVQHHLRRKWTKDYWPPPLSRLPLRGLARSCKLPAQEIRNHRQSLLPGERHAIIRILVRSDRFEDDDHNFYLSHASCPAKDLTILRLEYTVLVSAHYWTHHFPQFQDFGWILLEPSISNGLPDVLDVQVFLHFRQDESCPPDEDIYAEEVEDTCRLVERSCQARCILPKVQRLMGLTVEPWRPLSTAD
jgi:hypothetical protein